MPTKLQLIDRRRSMHELNYDELAVRLLEKWISVERVLVFDSNFDYKLSSLLSSSLISLSAFPSYPIANVNNVPAEIIQDIKLVFELPACLLAYCFNDFYNNKTQREGNVGLQTMTTNIFSLWKLFFVQCSFLFKNRIFFLSFFSFETSAEGL